MKGKEVIELLFQRMEALGADLATCEAAVWFKEELEKNPELTIEEMVDMVEVKIERGEANHGWILPGLSLVWDELTEEQRLKELAVLHKGGALATVLNRRHFKGAFSEKEKALLTECFTSCKAEAALRRLENG